MGPLGWQETVVIFIVALLIFGPKKLPELGRNFAKALSEFRRASSELKETFHREMNSIEQEGREIQKVANDYTSQITSEYESTSEYGYDDDYGYQYDQGQSYSSEDSSTGGASATQGADSTSETDSASASAPEGTVAANSSPSADSSSGEAPEKPADVSSAAGD